MNRLISIVILCALSSVLAIDPPAEIANQLQSVPFSYVHLLADGSYGFQRHDEPRPQNVLKTCSLSFFCCLSIDRWFLSGAQGKWSDQIYTTGWGLLEVHGFQEDCTNEEMAYTAGFFEGAAHPTRNWQMATNIGCMYYVFSCVLLVCRVLIVDLHRHALTTASHRAVSGCEQQICGR